MTYHQGTVSTTHTITNIPDEVWEWAREQGQHDNQGPATFLRTLIIGIAMNGKMNTKPPPITTKENALTTVAKKAIVEVLENRKIYGYACKCILQANDWDFIDPAGMMQKPPHEVKDFLECCSYEAGMYADMFSTRRNLLKMIFDAYIRAHGGYHS